MTGAVKHSSWTKSYMMHTVSTLLSVISVHPSQMMRTSLCCSCELAVTVKMTQKKCTWMSVVAVEAAFHDTDTDILTDILARMSVSVSWNAGLTSQRITKCLRSRSPFNGAHSEYNFVRFCVSINVRFALT